ncbi:MAG: pirin family protein [Rudaea sp.]
MHAIRRAADRGAANLGWLNSRHTFSFGGYHDPAEVGFSDLLVINDDRVQAGKGFGEHAHQDMEIFSYVLEGALAHKDSLGTGSVIRPGDVQMMSAGTGVRHSEFNASQTAPVHFLQVWIVPARKRVAPRYQEARFNESEKRGRLRLIISPAAEAGSLSVYQDTRVYAGLFDADEDATLSLAPNRFAYVHVARGSVQVQGQSLAEGDGMRLRDEQRLQIGAGKDAEILVFDLRPNELPDF